MVIGPYGVDGVRICLGALSGPICRSQRRLELAVVDDHQQARTGLGELVDGDAGFLKGSDDVCQRAYAALQGGIIFFTHGWFTVYKTINNEVQKSVRKKTVAVK